MSHERRTNTIARLSRRTAIRRIGGGGAVAALLTAAGIGRTRAGASEASAWRSESLEFDITPHDSVSITLAGSGPPQRGDHFYVDAQIYAVGDVNGTQVGTYHCFGAWITAADATDAVAQRLTTVQFLLEDGSSIMGLINEGGADPSGHVGAVQGGTGTYASALGTFQQIFQEGIAVPGVGTPSPATAAGTPAAGQTVVRTVFDLLLPPSA